VSDLFPSQFFGKEEISYKGHVYGRVPHYAGMNKPEDWRKRRKFFVIFAGELFCFAQKRHARNFCFTVGIGDWRIGKGPDA
jgi:hypothetical protein